MEPVQDSTKSIELLSELVCNQVSASSASTVKIRPTVSPSPRLAELIAVLTKQDLHELKVLAVSNHVIVRAFESLRADSRCKGNREAAEWVQAAVEDEQRESNMHCDFSAIFVPLYNRADATSASLSHWITGQTSAATLTSTPMPTRLKSST